jgi:hypothetical protein
MYNYYYRDKMGQGNIIASARGDVTGDRIPDNVYLTGTKTPDSPFYPKILPLVIQNGMTGRFTSIKLSEKRWI